MKALKKLGSITLITLILITGFIQLENKSYFVFADSSTDQWTTVTTNQELAEAFRYYCKSRNLVIEGSVLDALTSFTTNSFNAICNTLGIDVTALQAHLKRSTDSNGKVQFLFDQFGVTAYNRIFAEFLQNNNLEVGDSADEQNNTLYSGEVITDLDGYSCLVSAFNYTSFTGLYGSVSNTSSTSPNLLYIGTPYKYTGLEMRNNPITLVTGFEELSSSTRVSLPYRNANANSRVNTTFILDSTYMSYASIYVTYNSTVEKSGMVGVFKNVYNNTYYVGSISKGANFTSFYGYKIKVPSKESASIYITTNNLTINSNNYTDNSQTVINNEGDVYNYDYDDDDPPVNPPSGDGGDSPSDWGVELPDLDINWILAGKENKFPFDIPFNIMFALSLLNAEPEAPHFEGTINFGFTSYNYDIDFIQFDPVAVIFRRLMFLAFIFGLMFLTKQLIWG